MYSKHRDFRIHTGRPATGLAGVRAIVPPDVTPRLIEDTGDTGDTDSATEINEMQRIKNDAMRYTQVLVSSAIARATKRVILPMLERSLTQVINLKLDVKEGKGEKDKEKEKDKVQEGERERVQAAPPLWRCRHPPALPQSLLVHSHPSRHRLTFRPSPAPQRPHSSCAASPTTAGPSIFTSVPPSSRMPSTPPSSRRRFAYTARL